MANTIGFLAIRRTSEAVIRPGPDTPMNTSAPSITSEMVPDLRSVLLFSANHCLAKLRLSRPFEDGALAIAADDVLHARAHQDLGARDTGGTDAGDDDVEIFHLLVDDLERVDERRQRDHRGAVLIVVEDRDVDALLQLFLDVETVRRGDVLEVDAAEASAPGARRSR